MARRMAPSHERIIFPAWSEAQNANPDTYVPRRRRQQQCRNFAVKVFLPCIALAILLLLYRRPGGDSDSALGKTLSQTDLRDLNLASVPQVPLAADNPWRGAGRRRRNDMIISIPGCGGRFQQAIGIGDTASVRYAIKGGNGQLLDASKKSVSIKIGSGQVENDIERALIGICGGEAIRFDTTDGRKVIIYVEGVGLKHFEDGGLADRLAAAVVVLPGRRGRSCSATCGAKGLVCEEKAFKVVNNCPRLREAFACVKCEVAAAGSGGPDMPNYVVLSAPVGHARGACLVSPHVDIARCTARFEYTKRLCPCLGKEDVAKL